MLILTRRIGESIRINDDITVTVLGVQGMQFDWGASKRPRRSPFTAREIYERIQAGEGAGGSSMALDYDSRTDKFVVRLPDGMRDQVNAAATADDRSMNSLIVKATREYLTFSNASRCCSGLWCRRNQIQASRTRRVQQP